MKAFKRIVLSLVLAISVVMPSLSFKVSAATYVANWGQRGVVATSLSNAAVNFYTKYSVDFATVSQLKGGTNQGLKPTDAANTALYNELQEIMSNAQTKVTNYDETRYLYKYTDCINENTSNISCFYSGKTLSSTWDSGNTWNREHTWPNSKGSGDSENDIMMLRPTSSSINSARGNKPYGESTGYYDPNHLGQNVRGDVARIMLYVYTRWENSTNLNNLWATGTSTSDAGVMENVEVMLRWIEEDPVDTWELGRNDAVQSITGTRNIFVDYPEYAFLLFGRSVPTTMQTPSGIAKGGVGSLEPCEHENLTNVPYKAPTCTEPGNTAGVKCTECGTSITAAETIPATGHTFGAGVVTKNPECAVAGVTTFTCSVCGGTKTESIKALGHNFGDDGVCSTCGAEVGTTSDALALFELGANGNATHVDNGTDTATYSETSGKYTLNITNGVKMYPNCFDAKGNSCIKIGTSKVVGSFTLTVPNEVNSVVFSVAQYKANTTKISVNGTQYSITTASDNGAYTDISVDTSANKTVNFTTVSGGIRCMINSITFYGAVVSGGEGSEGGNEGGNENVDPEIAELLAKDVLTIAEAIKVANSLASGESTTKEFYVTGVISEVTNTTYGNFYITDSSTTEKFLIYGLYDSTGSVRYDALTVKPAVGDTVRVYGAILNYMGNTPEIKNARLMSHTLAGETPSACTHANTTALPAVAPTCTQTGLTAGSKCTDCGEVVVAQQTVPATGHTMVDGACSVCGATSGSDSSDSGSSENCNHSFGNWVVTKEPTTEDTGLKTRECIHCGATDSTIIPAIRVAETGGCGASIDFGSMGIVVIALAGIIIDKKRKG